VKRIKEKYNYEYKENILKVFLIVMMWIAICFALTQGKNYIGWGIFITFICL